MDGQGLVLPLMDGLRNGPYRMCHTASGDVLMCYRGGPKYRFGSLYQEKSGIDDVSSQEGSI